MWVQFVVGSRPSSEKFFFGYSGFPLSSKTNISNLQFDLNTVDEETPRGCATADSHLFIYLFILRTISLCQEKQHFVQFMFIYSLVMTPLAEINQLIASGNENQIPEYSFTGTPSRFQNTVWVWSLQPSSPTLLQVVIAFVLPVS